MLSVNNLSFSYNKVQALKNISETFTEGEIAGITGSAASGKSTLIRILAGALQGYEGDILLHERGIKLYTRNELDRLISHYSFSSESINPEATVADWVISGRRHFRKRLSPYTDTDRETASREMSLFGIEHLAQIRLKHIPASMVQMASLARTFCARSEILLLEKPETGLDIRQRLLLVRALKKYTSDGNRLVVLSSSDLNFISSSCDRIVVLDSGTIAETGNHGIITSEMIKKYYNVEAVVTRNIYSGLPGIQIIE